MTVNELRHLLFDLDNQDAEIVIMADGVPCDMNCVSASEVDPSIVYMVAT